MENVRINPEILQNHIIAKLPMLLENGTKAYAKQYIYIGMKNLLDDANNLQDMQIFASTFQVCKNFAEKNQLQDLLNYCTVWNRAGVEKLNAITASNSQKNNDNNENLANFINDQLQKFSEVLSAKKIDVDMMTTIIDRLTDFKILLEEKGVQIYSQQELEKVKNHINQQLKQAHDTISFANDEMDGQIKM